MCITGKGPEKDGAISPYLDSKHSYGFEKNVGQNEFSFLIWTKKNLK